MIQRGSSRPCYVSNIFPFWSSSELFLVIFVVEFSELFLANFLVGVTYEDLVPLCLMTLPQELPWIGLDLVVFGVPRVYNLEGEDPRFPLIESVLVEFLWWRGCLGGNPTIPEVSLQSVGWIERSGDGKLRVDSQLGFLGVKDRYGEPERGEWMGADKNSSWRRWELQQDEHDFHHTSPTHYPSWPSPRSHWSATRPRNRQTTLRAKNTPRRAETCTACCLCCTGQTDGLRRSDQWHGQTSGQSRSARWLQ
jgi:hypothetical protein